MDEHRPTGKDEHRPPYLDKDDHRTSAYIETDDHRPAYLDKDEHRTSAYIETDDHRLSTYLERDDGSAYLDKDEHRPGYIETNLDDSPKTTTPATSSSRFNLRGALTQSREDITPAVVR